MPVTASAFFEFLGQNASRRIERREVNVAAFATLRRNFRAMQTILSDGVYNGGREISDQLRTILMEWLTAPVRFDDAMFSSLCEMGLPESIGKRWGDDFRRCHLAACAAARELAEIESPMRLTLAVEILELYSLKSEFRIYCHKKSRKHFESLCDEYDLPEFPAAVFLHSLNDYRKAELFETLIKIGPLRPWGWGAVPDAVLTAPRFNTLIQIVWSGCADENGFGYDPVFDMQSSLPGAGNTDGTENHVIDRGQKWTLKTSRPLANGFEHFNPVDFDEFDNSAKVKCLEEPQPVLMVELEGEQGILLSRKERVLTVDTKSWEIGYKKSEDLSEEDTLLVIPFVEADRTFDMRAENGYFSHIWKEKLRIRQQQDITTLENSLRDAGLFLINLRQCIDLWCNSPHTVIHAPREMKHFKILIEVLGIDFAPDDRARAKNIPWWKFAWDEISRSRGKAIRSATLGQQAIDDQLPKVLNDLKDEVMRHEEETIFQLNIPCGSAIGGILRFYRIIDIEDGFMAPRDECGLLCDLEGLDRWRE